jgi:hypothetical protein
MNLLELLKVCGFCDVKHFDISCRPINCGIWYIIWISLSVGLPDSSPEHRSRIWGAPFLDD